MWASKELWNAPFQTCFGAQKFGTSRSKDFWLFPTNVWNDPFQTFRALREVWNAPFQTLLGRTDVWDGTFQTFSGLRVAWNGPFQTSLCTTIFWNPPFQLFFETPKSLKPNLFRRWFSLILLPSSSSSFTHTFFIYICFL